MLAPTNWWPTAVPDHASHHDAANSAARQPLVPASWLGQICRHRVVSAPGNANVLRAKRDRIVPWQQLLVPQHLKQTHLWRSTLRSKPVCGEEGQVDSIQRPEHTIRAAHVFVTGRVVFLCWFVCSCNRTGLLQTVPS